MRPKLPEPSALGAAMRATIFSLLIAVFVAGCSTATMTRGDLVARMGGSYVYRGSRFLYLGTKGGYDYVMHRWDDYSGNPGERTFRFRSGELPVGAPMAFTEDESRWRPFNPWKK